MDRFVKALNRREKANASLKEERTALCVVLESLEGTCASSKKRLPPGIQADLQPLCNRVGNLFLNCEYVLQFPVVLLRPQMVSICDIYQLGGNPETISRSPDTPLENSSHIKLLADSAQIRILALERKRRSSRNYMKIFNMRKSVDDLLGSPIAKKLVFWVRSEIYEGEDSNRGFGGCSCDVAQKPIAPTRDGLNEARGFGGIPQSLAQAFDGVIDAVVEVDERVRRPDL